MPPAGALLLTLAAVIALAVHLVRPPHRHAGDQLPGLTYEAERRAPRAPLALVVTSVQDNGPAAKADIAAGDVIDGIDGRPIASLSSVGRAVRSDARKGPLLHIRHKGESRYKHLPSARAPSARPREPHVAKDPRRRR
jgi:membrane-associated protease RseP (regulator of RpoE activity)